MCAHMSFVAVSGGGQLVGLSRGEIESESETIDREKMAKKCFSAHN